MSASARVETLATIADFDAFLEGQDETVLWELVGGYILAMTNPTDIHEQIVSNIGAAVKRAADAVGCQAFFGGMRVQRSDDARGLDKPRPDIMVRCGALIGRNYHTDPLAVVEVLSPSTIDLDRGDKLRFYKELPTLRHIALVYQDQQRVELYYRMDDGWLSRTLAEPDDRLAFEPIGFEMKLRQVYLGIDPALMRGR